jgi:hypothetical protein
LTGFRRHERLAAVPTYGRPGALAIVEGNLVATIAAIELRSARAVEFRATLPAGQTAGRASVFLASNDLAKGFDTLNLTRHATKFLVRSSRLEGLSAPGANFIRQIFEAHGSPHTCGQHTPGCKISASVLWAEIRSRNIHKCGGAASYSMPPSGRAA